jgi:hypothetical protein
MRYLFDNSPNVWNFEDALKENLFELNQEDNTYHGFSIFPLTGEFLKSKNHPTVQNELDWYNSDDAKDFREEYDLITEEDGNDIWARMLAKNRKLPSDSFTEYLHMRSTSNECKGKPYI